MSELIQPAPSPHAAPLGVAAESHEHTPGVACEGDNFDFRLIVWLGVGLATLGIVIHVAVWCLLGGLDKINAVPPGSVSELALEDASKPLRERLDEVPPPHLEGIERERSILVLHTGGDEERFYVAPDASVRIKDKGQDNYREASLFELREDASASVIFYTSGGEAGGFDVATSVTSPPIGYASDFFNISKKQRKRGSIMRWYDGLVVKVEPRGVAASREWAEVQRKRYGWIDRDKGIVHIPIEKAIDDFGSSGKLGMAKKQEKGADQLPLLRRSNSGRDPEGGKR